MSLFVTTDERTKHTIDRRNCPSQLVRQIRIWTRVKTSCRAHKVNPSGAFLHERGNWDSNQLYLVLLHTFKFGRNLALSAILRLLVRTRGNKIKVRWVRHKIYWFHLRKGSTRVRVRVRLFEREHITLFPMCSWKGKLEKGYWNFQFESVINYSAEFKYQEKNNLLSRLFRISSETNLR